MPQTIKYTEARLREAVKRSFNMVQVLKHLGIKSYSGGFHTILSRRIKQYGIDTSHFCGNRKSMIGVGKKSAEEILRERPATEHRTHAYRLRRALIESDVPYACAACNQGAVWQGRQLTLEVDHINGRCTDDRKENLRFLCPNCHSQV